jgi:hypothetical protein
MRLCNTFGCPFHVGVRSNSSEMKSAVDFDSPVAMVSPCSNLMAKWEVLDLSVFLSTCVTTVCSASVWLAVIANPRPATAQLQKSQARGFSSRSSSGHPTVYGK